MSVDSTDAQIEENDEAFVKVQINGTPVEMKVDKCNVLLKKVFEQVKNEEQIRACIKFTNLVAFRGSKIKTQT